MASFGDNDWLARCAFRAHRGASQQQVMTLHYVSPGGVNGTGSLQDLADRLRDDVLPKFKAVFHTSWTIEPVVVTDEKDPLAPSVPREQKSSGVAGPGTRSTGSSPLPLAMSAVASVRTSSIGRSFRGRIWIPGTKLEEDYADGAWTAGGEYRVLGQLLLDSIPLEPDIVTGTGDPTFLCVYSRTRRGRNQDNYAEHVTALTSDWTVHWLRRRDDGV